MLRRYCIQVGMEYKGNVLDYSKVMTKGERRRLHELHNDLLAKDNSIGLTMVYYTTRFSINLDSNWYHDLLADMLTELIERIAYNYDLNEEELSKIFNYNSTIYLMNIHGSKKRIFIETVDYAYN